MEKKLRIITALFLAIVIGACSSSSETTQTESVPQPEDEVYVFDDVSDIEEQPAVEEQPIIEDEPVVFEEATPVPVEPSTVFIVQVGAFSSRERAERFKLAHQSEIEWEMNITYSTRVGLYVIQLPYFTNRSEAEIVRNRLWSTKTFSDAFIITDTK